jgi:integrase
MREQKGFIFKASGAWYLKYRQDVIEDGVVRRKLCTHRLADVDDYCRTVSDARKLVKEFLRPLNEGKVAVGSTMPLTQFVEATWLPHVESEVRPATFCGYRQMWRLYLKPKFGNMRLCDIKPKEVAPYLDWLQKQKGPRAARYSKTVGCMMFNYAVRPLELLEANPFGGRMLRGQDRKQGYATNLNEFAAMLQTFKDQPQARAVLGLTFFAGLRPSEVRGLKWPDYDPRSRQILIHTSVWKKTVNEPKTEAATGLVPVNQPLADLLGELWEHEGRPAEGWILRGERGGPLSLDTLSRKRIQPALKAVGIEWHSYRALRRGAGTITTLAARDKGLAARGLLRHKTLTTTTQFYVGEVPEETRAAVEQVGELFQKCSKRLPEVERPRSVNYSQQAS